MHLDRIFTKYKWFFYVSIPFLSLVLHWHVFTKDVIGVHAIRQAQTQQNILNFHRHDPNILNPRTNVITQENELTILRYEFPILQWSIGMLFHITGESMVLTRIIMFSIGLLTLVGMYYWLKQLFEREFVVWAGTWAFSFSPLFFYYTMNPMPDILALGGTIWAMGFFFHYQKSKKLSHACLSALCMSIGIASKLPFILFLAVPGFWWIQSLLRKKFSGDKSALQFPAIYLAFLLPTVVWYGWVIPSWSNGVVEGIFANPLTSEKTWDILHFHLTEMFPKRLLGQSSMILLFTGLFFVFKYRKWKDVRFHFLAVAGLGLIAYWVYEFSMIEKVHDYYMMPFLPLLFIMVAFGIHQLYKLGRIGIGLLMILLFLMPYITYDLTRHDWTLEKSYFVLDAFRYKEALRQAVPAEAKCIFVNDPTQYLLPYLTDKYGFVFRDNHLPADWVKDMINRFDATYMYSDTRIIDENPEVRQYLDKMVLEQGAIRVFKLIAKGEG